jgi:predicted amidohydrolase
VLEIFLKIAAIQFRPPKGTPTLARERLLECVQTAAESGAKLIVCPEMATTGYIYASAEAVAPHAEAADGPTLAALGPIASRHAAWIVCGYVERDGPHLYNAALIIGPSGERIASYRKCLLYIEDTRWAEPGNQRFLIDMGDVGKMMPAICMDLNDDSHIRAMHKHRPRFLSFCTNWVDQGTDPLPYWRQRLAGWSGWFIAANSWGEDSGTRFTGLSTIVGPDGEARARASATGDDVLVVDIES